MTAWLFALALLVPALTLRHADPYPDPRRRESERDMFLLATGAAVQNLLLALHAQGYASAWVSSSLFCKEEARDAVGLGEEWLPMGAVACGPPPEETPPPRPPSTRAHTSGSSESASGRRARGPSRRPLRSRRRYSGTTTGHSTRSPAAHHHCRRATATVVNAAAAAAASHRITRAVTR